MNGRKKNIWLAKQRNYEKLLYGVKKYIVHTNLIV